MKEQELDTWEKVILNFFEYKVAACTLAKTRKTLNDKTKKIEGLSLEKDAKKINKLEAEIVQLYESLNSYRNEAPKGEINSWLDKTINTKISVGKRTIQASHILKFTHSSADNAGVLVEYKEDKPLLTTSMLKHKTLDLAHNNGNLITVSRFLALELVNVKIHTLILAGCFEFLEGFYKTKEQLKKWQEGFSNLVEDRSINSAEMAKQVFYPVSQKDFKYHVLVPLHASSMSEKIYQNIRKIQFGSEQADIRRCKKNVENKSSKYHSGIAKQYLNLAVEKFGGAQPQNVSMLNKGRTWKADSKPDSQTYGVSYLFKTSPPTWESQVSPPVNKASFFYDGSLTVHCKNDIEFLRDFLLRYQKVELSIKDPKRKQWIESWVGNIIDEVLNYVATIHELKAGWSSDSNIKLKVEHQYFLDPYRHDNKFQGERKLAEWQKVICSDFAAWLNYMLVGKGKQFTPQSSHTRLWYSLIEEPIRELNYLIDQENKIRQGDDL